MGDASPLVTELGDLALVRDGQAVEAAALSSVQGLDDLVVEVGARWGWESARVGLGVGVQEVQRRMVQDARAV